MNLRELIKKRENCRRYYFFSYLQKNKLIEMNKSDVVCDKYNERFVALNDGRIEEYTDSICIDEITEDYHKKDYSDSIFLGEGKPLHKAVEDFIFELETTEYPSDRIFISEKKNDWTFCCSCNNKTTVYFASDGHLYCGSCVNEIISKGKALHSEDVGEPNHDCKFNDPEDEGEGDQFTF